MLRVSQMADGDDCDEDFGFNGVLAAAHRAANSPHTQPHKPRPHSLCLDAMLSSVSPFKQIGDTSRNAGRSSSFKTMCVEVLIAVNTQTPQDKKSVQNKTLTANMERAPTNAEVLAQSVKCMATAPFSSVGPRNVELSHGHGTSATLIPSGLDPPSEKPDAL